MEQERAHHTPVGASSCRRGYGRPHTLKPGALAQRQRRAEDTTGECGTRGRTDRSKRFHSRAGKEKKDFGSQDLKVHEDLFG